MNKTALHLPLRAAKPRQTGLTMVIDGGIPLGLFTDLVSSAAEYIDFVKFGWGTAVVTNCLREKIEVLNANEIGYYFGGTLFEKYVLQGRFEDFRKFCENTSASTSRCRTGRSRCPTRKRRATYASSPTTSPSCPRWASRTPPFVRAAAAEHVGRVHQRGPRRRGVAGHAGGQGERKSGICRPDGALRFGLIEDVLASGISPQRLLFEAPTTALQAHFITRLGPDVNLGNVPAQGIIGLETLRLGLRADTLTAFE
jgi:phosphosulfolactate synthase